MHVGYDAQLCGLGHCVQCSIVLLIVHNGQEQLDIVYNEHELVHIVYNVRIVQIGYNIDIYDITTEVSIDLCRVLLS